MVVFGRVGRDAQSVYASGQRGKKDLSYFAMSSTLEAHPIFSLPKSFSGPLSSKEKSWLELSTSTLPNFKDVHPTMEDGPAPSGRRQVMVLRDSDLIVAAGKEIRITHLGDTKINHSTQKQYKVRYGRVLPMWLLTCSSDTSRSQRSIRHSPNCPQPEW